MKMSNRFTAALLAFCLIFSLFAWADLSVVIDAGAAWDGVASSSFSSGSGTKTSPYIIKTVGQMGYFRQLLSEGMTFSGTYIKLMASLDMTGGNWTPVSTSFCGDFNGNGYTLTTDTQFVGSIGEGGRVSNLKIVCPTVSDLPLVCSTNNGTIEGVVACGTVTDEEYYSGGLVRYNKGTMMNVGFSGEVGGANMYVAGLVYENTGTIQNGYVSATFDAYSSGRYGASSEDSVARFNSGTITDVYYDSSMPASSDGTATSVSTMKTQTFVNTLNANNQSLITKWGVSSSTVNNGFPVPLADSKSDIVCHLSGHTEDAFISKSGTHTIVKSANRSCSIYYTVDGTDPASSSTRKVYSSSVSITTDTVIKMVAYESGVYGRVTTQKVYVMSGEGTEASPYQIKTKANLEALAVAPDAHFVLKNSLYFYDSDYSASGAFYGGWQPIESFSGVLEGNGNVISNLQGNWGGFIKSNSGTISGIRFVDLRLSSSESTFGAVADYNSGTITRCYADLDVAASNSAYNVGGMVGYNSGTVSYCMIEGDMTLTLINTQYKRVRVGGFTGCGIGDVENCYSKLNMVIKHNGADRCDYVYYGGISANDWVSNCRNDGTVKFSVSCSYDLITDPFSTGGASYCFGDLNYTSTSAVGGGMHNNQGSGSYRYTVRSSLESYYEGFDFDEKWMILANGPMPQGIMNSNGLYYTKTDYRRPACEDGYTKYVDQSGKSYTVALTQNGIHLGGEATCSEQAVCELCGTAYGELNPEKHSGLESATVENNSAYPFTYSGGKYTSTNKAHSSSSVLTVTVKQSVTIGVSVTCSTEANYDKAIIARNGTTCETFSGTESGNVAVNLVAGDVLTVTYKKDGSQSKGTDSITVEFTIPNAEATCSTDLVCSDCGVVLEKAHGHSFLTGVNDSTYPFTYDPIAQTYTSTNKGSETSTYTFTAQRDVSVTLNYSVSTSSYHYIIIAKNGSYLVNRSGTFSSITTVGLKQGDVLTISYKKSSYYTSGTDSITFSLTQTPVSLCTETVRCPVCDLVLKTASTHTLVKHNAQAPTCTSAGWNTYYTCEDCAYTTYARLAATGHTYVDHEAKAATCTEVGWNAYKTCEKCDYTTYKEIAATGHTVSSVIETNDTTYPFTYSNGTYTSTNKTSSSVSAYTITAKGTVSVTIAYTVSSEPSCDKLLIVKNGSTLYTYSGVTSGTVTVSLVSGDKLQIKYSKDGSLNKNSDCITFKLTMPGNAKPTCTESVNCITCGGVVEAALGHTIVSHAGKAPTCTEKGWNAYETCSKCNYTTYTELPAGHSIVNHEAKTPTCTEIGWNAYETCANCDYTTYAELPAAGHSIVTHEAKAPTCTEIGWNAYETCENCDHTTYTELPAGHSIVNHEAKTPTCTEIGWNAYETCANCDYTTYVELPAGHSIVNHEAKTPTCTEIGWNAYETCANCDYTTYAELPANGHEWDDGEVVTYPTFDTTGLMRYKCGVCNETRDEILPEIKQEVDEKAPQIVVSAAQAVAGDTITVEVSLKNNPGIVAAKLHIGYDSEALTLVEVKDKGLLGNAIHNPELVSPYILCWSNYTATENFESDGAIVELVFKIAKDAEKKVYPVTVTYDYNNYDIMDWQMNNIEFAVVNGGVDVMNILFGDVNGDGAVDNRDAMYLDRYLAYWEGYGEGTVNLLLADVNRDGKVNNADSMILARHLAEWDDYLLLPFDN